MHEICRRVKKKVLDVYNRIFVIRVRVAVLGPEKSGKSTIVNRMFKDRLRYLGSQKDMCLYKYDEDYINYVVYDVCGKRSSRVRWDYFYKRCDVILYCVDASSTEEKWVEAREELKSMLYRNPWIKRSILVLGTKNEKKSALGCMEIIRKLELFDINGLKVSCFSVSAKKNTNIECIMSWIRDQCYFLRWSWGSRTIRRWWRLGSLKY
ncbi:hypothetical protein EROM_051030 [Encephalitozoon romaleae SJ-2008]|uniref:Uncharacterized protein n=1 Tax=Encephalitozoon romaleae (strain SJ-2008) TaxID=1178016 RepID=I7AMR9_ENCRO|nr:hypothetical protein EROM_051030 [Encephalitozoon romaleae SJ-2008]AFN83034.1 hypothetical protein EROM_051030 [Encephalitozoon romaleae SJ-2008]